MSHKTLTVDVREDIRNGGNPFAKIMSAVTELQANDQLLLIAPFEPVPLYAVLGKQGFTHSAWAIESGDWEVVFTRSSNSLTNVTNPTSALRSIGNETGFSSEDSLEVDARGLEPPQPMVKILETLTTLPAGATLRARTDRRPIHLYAQLEERGFTAETEQQADGSFITHIRHS